MHTEMDHERLVHICKVESRVERVQHEEQRDLAQKVSRKRSAGSKSLTDE